MFGSSLSKEYLLAAQHFNLNQAKLWKLAVRAQTMIFGPDMLKTLLMMKMHEFIKKRMNPGEDKTGLE